MKIDDYELIELLGIDIKTLNRKNQYICTCPFCGKVMHFYISKTTQLFDCKKCGEVGNIFKLLNFFDKLYLLKDGVRVIKRDLIQTITEQKEVEISELEITELSEIKLPIGFKLVKNSDYLSKRKITKEEIEFYKIGQTNLMNKFKDYIIFPVKENKLVKGFVGRYEAKKVPKEFKRYKNSDGFSSSELLYGIDEVIKGKTRTVILVEGIFDKISVDRFLDLREDVEMKCLCTFGKKISDVQIKKIFNKNVLNIVLLYDFDAIREIKKYGLELQKYFFTTITFTDSKKDIDECTLEEAIEVFNNTMRPIDFNLNVIGKVKS